MRAERKGPLLTPQHISHAGREPRTLTPNPRPDTRPADPPSRPHQCHRGMVGGDVKVAHAAHDRASTAVRRSNAARVNSNVSVTSLSPQRTEELTDPRNESYIYIYMCHSRVTSAPSLIITELSMLSSLIIFR